MSHLGERECSIQRRNQKVVEVAPSPGISSTLRVRITEAAVRLAEAVQYNNIGTFEFLVDATADAENAKFAFIEANPRLQVEHTVTEEVTGVDLVQLQLQLAAGRSLTDLGLLQSAIPQPRGFALQVRINMETLNADGSVRPAGGTLSAFEAPSGLGIRTDTFGYVGYRTSPRFDSLLAKLIGHTPSNNFAHVVTKTYRALCEFKIEGAPTNIPFLQSLLQHPEFVAGRMYTRFVEDHIAELVASTNGHHQRLFFEQAVAARSRAGAKIHAVDPLAAPAHGKGEDGAPSAPAPSAIVSSLTKNITGLEGTVAVKAPDICPHRGQQMRTRATSCGRANNSSSWKR